MSTIEIIIELLPTLTAVELCTVLKTGAELVAKSAKGGAPKAARATGVVPPQLQKNKEWVDIVLVNAQQNGWEAFEAKEGAEVILMEASVETEEGHRFEDGSELNMKQAMSLAKHLKDSGSELYEAFSEAYDAEHPKEEKTVTAAVPVKRTRAEISAAAEERKAKEEAEKAEKAAIRQAEKEAREAKKAEEELLKAAARKEREEKAAAKKAEVEAKKTAKLPTSTTSVAMAASLAKIMAAKKAAATEDAPVAVAAVAAPVKKTLSQMWKAPPVGAWKPIIIKGKTYLCNSEFHLYTKGAEQGTLGDWAGIFVQAEDRIDDSAPEPVQDDE